MKRLAPLLSSAVQTVKSTRYENPVVTKEIRTRMRGAKAHWLMMFYVLLLGLVVLLTYYGLWTSAQLSGMGSDPRNWLRLRVGFQLFASLTITQAILIAFVCPALTSGSLTIEKEQQTLEMLSLTTLSPRNIVAGKLTSAMLFVLMLLGCSLPIAGICFMFGSISPLEIGVSYLMLIGWAFLLSSTGVFFSSVFKKTSGASLVTFGLTVIYCLFASFVVMMWIVQGLFRYGYGHGHTPSSGYSGGFIYSGLSPFTASYLALDMAKVFSVKVPVAAVALAFDLSIGLLLLTLATTKMPFHRACKTRAIRLWTLGITVIGTFLLFGNLATVLPASGSNMQFIFMFVTLLVMIMPTIPAFATGPLKKGRNLIKEILLGPARGKIFERNPVGGLWFLILWFVCEFAVIAITLSIMASMSSSAVASFPDLPLLTQSVAALLVSVVGISAVSILCSSIIPTRLSAAAVSILFLVLTWAVYPIIRVQHMSAGVGSGWQNTYGPLWQLAYLWPGTSLDILFGHWRQGVNAPQLWLPDSLAISGCVIAWLFVTIVALGIASRYAGRKGITDE